MEPNLLWATPTLPWTYIALNRADEARGVLSKAQARKLEGWTLHLILYYLAFLRATHRDGAEVAWAAGKPGAEDPLLSAQSDTEAYYGRLARARDFTRRAVDSAIACRLQRDCRSVAGQCSLREAEFGNAAAARQGLNPRYGLGSGP